MRIMGIWMVVLVSFMALAECASTTPALAGETPGGSTPTAERPTFKEGNTFAFKSWTGQWIHTYLGERDGLHVFRAANRSTTWEYFLTKDINTVRSTRRGYEYENIPYWPGYKFPLSVGKSWQEDYTHSMPHDVMQRSMSVTVAAYEQVKVPAGTFWAFRLEATNQRLGAERPADETYWYSPEVGFTIKYYSREFRWEYELVKFSK